MHRNPPDKSPVNILQHAFEHKLHTFKVVKRMLAELVTGGIAIKLLTPAAVIIDRSCQSASLFIDDQSADTVRTEIQTYKQIPHIYILIIASLYSNITE